MCMRAGKERAHAPGMMLVDAGAGGAVWAGRGRAPVAQPVAQRFDVAGVADELCRAGGAVLAHPQLPAALVACPTMRASCTAEFRVLVSID